MIDNNLRSEDEIISSWKSSNVLVSIICNTFNHEKYIAQSIEGFLIQKTDFAIEVLIHDDASKDETVKIIKRFELKFPRIIKPIYQKRNKYSQGIKISTEIQIPRSTGKYIAVCEGDDYWTDPHKLAKQVKFLEQNTKYVGCFTNFMTVNNDGKVINKEGFKTMKSEYSHLDVLSNQTPKTLTVLYKKEYIPKEIPENLRKCLNGDLINASLISVNGPYKFMNFVSGAYRVHAGGVWSEIGNILRFKNQVRTSVEMLKAFSEPKQRNAILQRFNRNIKKLYKHEKKTNILKKVYYLYRYFYINIRYGSLKKHS